MSGSRNMFHCLPYNIPVLNDLAVGRRLMFIVEFGNICMIFLWA